MYIYIYYIHTKPDSVDKSRINNNKNEKKTSCLFYKSQQFFQSKLILNSILKHHNLADCNVLRSSSNVPPDALFARLSGWNGNRKRRRIPDMGRVLVHFQPR